MKTLTPEIMKDFGFDVYVDAKDPKKKYWYHPMFGRFDSLPEHRQFLTHIFDLGWKRNKDH